MFSACCVVSFEDESMNSRPTPSISLCDHLNITRPSSLAPSLTLMHACVAARQVARAVEAVGGEDNGLLLRQRHPEALQHLQQALAAAHRALVLVQGTARR